MLKKPASARSVAREARDMRETRDVDRVDFHLVSLVPRVQPISLGYPAGRGLPGPEGTTIEMDELRARIIPHPTVLQSQRGMAKLSKLDTGNIEVKRLPLDM